MKFKRLAVLSAVQNCLEVLREAIFELGDDEFLGSEEKLAKELGVSAPTLRQAARLLEHEQLLTIKRGVAGGYYTRRPDAQAAAHMAAVYLRTRKASIVEAYEVSKPVVELAVRLACRSTDKKLRAELEKLTARADRESNSVAHEWELDAQFAELLSKMTGNAVLMLLLSIFNDYGALVAATPTRSLLTLPKEYFASRSKIGVAILARDAEAALAHMRRRMQLVHENLTRVVDASERSASRVAKRAVK